LEGWRELMKFRDALISAYCETPCQVLPNVLWKTLAEVEGLQTTSESQGDVVSHLEMWDEKRLLLYWDRNRDCADLSRHCLASLSFALVHQDFLHAIPTSRFTIRKRYFRLIHRSGSTVRGRLPNGYSIVNVDVERETQAVAELIGRCYDDKHPTEGSVRGWIGHPVFERDLWIWVVDEEKGMPVGLGIAEADRSISEGSLEWIQVLPGYRGRGLGKGVVQELLSRLQGRVAFTTVAGEANNQSSPSPETFYRSCGFEGGDIWWVLRSSTGEVPSQTASA